MWEWRGDDGGWNGYNVQSNAAIEAQFVAGPQRSPPPTIEIRVNPTTSFTYSFDFARMLQINASSYATERPIRRRPGAADAPVNQSFEYEDGDSVNVRWTR